MFLKKLAENRPLTILYDQKGSLQKCKGRVCSFNLNEQTLSLKDDQHKVFCIQLSGIKKID
jgi:hypothetical protein